MSIVRRTPYRSTGLSLLYLYILQVYTKQASVLVASITCVSCRDTNQFSVSNSQVIKLVGGCDDCPLLDTVYRWTITRSDGVPLPINLVTTTTGASRRNLVVRSSVVEDGYAYRFAAAAALHTFYWCFPRSFHLLFFSTLHAKLY